MGMREGMKVCKGSPMVIVILIVEWLTLYFGIIGVIFEDELNLGVTLGHGEGINSPRPRLGCSQLDKNHVDVKLTINI